MRKMWVYDPQSGGKVIPAAIKPRIIQRILAHAEKNYAEKYNRIEVRFFGDETKWSMAFYTYSHEKYEPCIFDTGKWQGSPEEAFDTSAVYLTG